MTIGEAMRRLSAHPSDMTCAMTLWLPSDVHDCARGMGVELTSEQADDILSCVDRRQDADTGINWTVLEEYITAATEANTQT